MSTNESLDEHSDSIQEAQPDVNEIENKNSAKRKANIEATVKQLGERLNIFKSRSNMRNLEHNLSAPDLELKYTSTPVLTPVKENERPATNIAASGSEKLSLMRQQLEENKIRFARRSNSNQQIKNMVTKMKEKIGVTQQSLMETSELRRSMNDLSLSANDATDICERYKSVTDLSTRSSLNIDRERNKFLENRLRLLEKQLNKERNATQQAQDRIAELEGVKRDQQYSNNDVIKQLEEKLQQTQAEAVKNQELLKQRLQEESKVSTVATASVATETSAMEIKVNSIGENSDTDMQVKLEMAKHIQELQTQLEESKAKCLDLEDKLTAQAHIEITDNSVAEKIKELQSTISQLRSELSARDETIKKQEDDLTEKTIELNILNANVNVLEEKLENALKNKPLFLPSTEDINNGLQNEMQQLKLKLDENNKAMIKMKLKCKQYEKQIQKLGEGDELQQNVARLTKLNEELQQKIIELEDEKGQWQLAQVDDGSALITVAANANTTMASEVNKQQAAAIRLLEEQKHDLQQELQILQQGKETARVKSELTEVHFEEQLAQRLQLLEQEHQEKIQALEKKLSHYINENMELLDKIEKLSKSSSSAESIEIVERLTQQERAEIDEFNKRLESDGEDVERDATVVLANLVNEFTQTDIPLEAGESFAELREETTELKNKIELFTNERREVLERMEHMSAENADLTSEINRLNAMKLSYETQLQDLKQRNQKLEQEIKKALKENEQLSIQAIENSAQKAKLSQELTSLQKSSEVMAALDSNVGATLFDKCEKSLSKLKSELEAYRRANDENAKFNVSKKLAKEAKNVHTQLSELLQKVKEASTAVETVTVVETVVAVTAPNGKALAEYEQLTAQNSELKARVAELQRELIESRENSEVMELLQHAAIDSVKTDTTKESVSMKENVQDDELVILQSKLEDVQLQLRESHTAVLDQKQLIAEQATEMLQKQGIINKLQDELLQANNQQELENLREHLRNLEENGNIWQSTINQLREELMEANTTLNERTEEIHKQSEEFDHLLNEKEMIYEKQIEQMTRVRRELEGKLETCEGEILTLKTLVAGQKEQLIEAFSASDHKMIMKMLELQQLNEKYEQLRAELQVYKERSHVAANEQELSKECETLRESLKISKALAAQQVNELSNKQDTIETLNHQMIELYKTIKENTQLACDKDDEIDMFKQRFKEHNNEMQNLRKSNEEQKLVVDKLLNELHTHKANTPQLEAELQRLTKINEQLTKQNKTLEERVKEQRDKVKKYAGNLKKRTVEYQDLENKFKHEIMNKDTIDGTMEEQRKLEDAQKLQDQNAKIEALTQNIVVLEQSLNEANASINKLTEDLKSKIHVNLENQDTIKSLKQQLNEKIAELLELQEQINCFVNTLKPLQASSNQKLIEQQNGAVNLQTVLKTNSETIARQETELMQLQEQIQIMQQNIEAKERELVELRALELLNMTEKTNSQASEQERIIKELTQQLEAKSTKFEKSKEVIKQRNNTIQTLQRDISELNQKLAKQPEEEPAPDNLIEYKKLYEELQLQYQKLNERCNSERNEFQQTIARLETLHDGIQAKLQEDMSYIETLESENNQIKCKMVNLEETLHKMDQENRANLQHMQHLEERLSTYAVQTERNEEDLICRMNTLSAQEQTISQHLNATQNERDELKENLTNLQNNYEQLLLQHQKAIQDHKIACANLEAQIVAKSDELSKQMTVNEEEIARIQLSYENKLTTKDNEINELEYQLNDHMERTRVQKMEISEHMEKISDENAKQKDEIVRLRENMHMLEETKTELERDISWLRLQHEGAQQDQLDLQELRMQAMQDKTEIDHLRNQIETLATNHEQELQSLRQQIADFNTLGQNQTDDQVFIETENKRLTDLLAEKQALLENYERAESNSAINIDLQRQLNEKTELVTRLQRELFALQNELNNVRENEQEIISEIISAPSLFFDNVPASTPSIYFNSAHSTSPTAFDEIIQPRHPYNQLTTTAASTTTITTTTTCAAITTMATTQAATTTPTISTTTAAASEQPTIEDLQRNVSDLEKHAQDLEMKLVAHNQLMNAYQERIRVCQIAEQNIRQQAEQDLNDFQRVLDERDARLEHLEIYQNIVHEAEQKLLKALEDNKQLEAQLIDRDNKIKELQATLREHEVIESLNEILQVPATNAPSLNMFFGADAVGADKIDPASTQTTELFGMPQDQPVVEELIKPKTAYICQPSQPQNTTDAVSDWGVDDDPWFNAAETTAGENIVPMVDINASSNNFRHEMEADLRNQADKIRQLESQLEASEQQKQELQVKSAKLMKKLKELKQQQVIDATIQKQFASNNLDVAINDELKSQVEQLEQQLQESRKSNEQEISEKEKLKKRIDMLEAGNERMSELKEKQDREVQMYQVRIRELQEQLSKLDDWGNGDKVTTEETTTATPIMGDNGVTITSQQTKIDELQTEIQELNAECQELQAQLQQERISAQQKLNEVIEQTKEFAAHEKKIMEEHLKETEQTVEELRVQLEKYQQDFDQLKVQSEANCKATMEEMQNKLKEQSNELLNLRADKQQLNEQLEQLKTQMPDMVEQQTEVIVKVNEEHIQQLLEKESEILHLKHRIENLMREDQTEKLVLEILTKNQEIHMLKLKVKQLEEDKQDLVEQQPIVQRQVVQNEIALQNKQLQNQLEELKAQNNLLEQDKKHMEEELRILNDHVMKTLEIEDKMKDSVLELDMKNIEIVELRKSLGAFQAREEGTTTATTATATEEANEVSTLSQQQCELLIEQKCAEIAKQWQDYLAQREQEYQIIEANLRAEIVKLSKEEHTIDASTATERLDLNTSSDSSEQLIVDMRKVLEEQEIEIVMLKEQLAIRSAEYGRLAAQYDPFKLQNTLSASVANEELQKKLDKALYMLHERDMRCEEMTVELEQLLNERDTLQLKLSDTLRQVEIMKEHTNYNDDVAMMAVAGTTTIMKPTTQAVTTTAATMTSPNKDATSMHATTIGAGNTDSGIVVINNELNKKLSQLQTVNHSKDKAIMKEREQRIREMGQLQKDVAKLPPVTSISAAQTSGLDLSPSNRSPSTMLFNWLMGGSKSETDAAPHS